MCESNLISLFWWVEWYNVLFYFDILSLNRLNVGANKQYNDNRFKIYSISDGTTNIQMVSYLTFNTPTVKLLISSLLLYFDDLFISGYGKV